MAKEPRPVEELSIWEDARAMIRKARKEGIETVHERLDQQTPHCKFCELGTTCRNCTMGPCRISAKAPRGVCGADADVVVARNFGRFVTGGAAGHSDHGRDLIEVLEAIVEGETKDYRITDEPKLRAIAAEIGVATEGRTVMEVARDVMDAFYADFGSRRKSISFLCRVPEKRKAIWAKLGMTPRGVDREIAEMMHRTHMGCDNDAPNTMIHAARTALADGWGGSMIGTELSDVIFGTPTPKMSTANLAVIKKDQVNILVHGHNPVVSEMILAAAREPELIEQAKKLGATGINVAGLCCTGNELLMRQGIPMAGNHLMTELAIITGAVEAVVVDYQCIMPSLVQISGCYHTKFIDTAAKARFTGAIHFDIHPHNAMEQARKIVGLAVQGFVERDPGRVDIPGEPVDIMTGFSNEAVIKALGGSLDPLIQAIASGDIRGAVGIVGCNNPKFKQDSMNVGLAKELIKKDILVLVTGCVTTAAGKAGLLLPSAIDQAGPGLRKICGSLGIPPVLHYGSCVDNARILQLCAALANGLGVDISDLPVGASSPEWYSEKAAAIGLYAVASGIYTHLGHPPNILGSETVTNLAVSGLEDLVGACFVIEPDPVKAAELFDIRIRAKRKGLGLSE
ncbi:MAG: anaerobic carbon-monoxide dehydrogenase catalytic subunit [Pseudodesulfovibrio sp.]|uniref:Carbon monoxide dehydrogenase n=1 Tax=Pseudodesulfovibrio aespoeensis (strain ATCC 700646 / DSM 10631 / Aspo-2) TaxID=643562 RepID=E6VY91_PSEA9|nr:MULTISPECIES: anaerobic carbon-monoxide dehydrogenase catalytic subunit [Pseudodesulfovibrio]MBU4192664.1 anaerobic carbon-monoxide dehydrogenase catalytic subunit [Pseudomonadota bacterium]ADU61549.1 carbon-monoxide dehydrogenase, catalytic subunit [Pseudodesulfovibrio aespoeensis Aspo-2]MBU4243100.1 anaerobic carbon-monoxide dehydrogenase catalytic subunit [Pseudomonadota bacterium]MBU4377487.1 anaerobic carbon-monoxide dehydrogenase catalytic subunit [Pseudomonadota bacterium]MBU4474630.